MDFVADSLITGRRFRALTIVDDFSRESLAIEVDTSLGGQRVVAVLDRLAEIRGLPEVITIDNGPEFDSADATHFFEPFYGTSPGGMGLGLTLSRRVVIKHSGRIGIDRSKGVTRASFIIPLNLTPAALNQA